MALLSFCGTNDSLANDKICRWPLEQIGKVTWHISAPPSNLGLSHGDVTATFKQAMEAWVAVSGLKHEYSSNPKTALISAGWHDFRDGPYGVLADSGLPCGGVRQIPQRYDIQTPWVIAKNPPQSKIDLFRVIFHEVGHAIGIPHISSGNAMQASYDVKYYGPQQGDTIEARARYPKVISPVEPDKPPPTGDVEEILALLRRGDKTFIRLLGKTEFPLG